MNELKKIKELEGYSIFGGYEVVFENRKQFEWLIEQAEKVRSDESEYEIHKALLQAEQIIGMLNSMVIGGEKHSAQTEKMVALVIKDIKNVKYSFMD